MKFNLINNYEDWESINNEWDELLKSSFAQYPFLEFWYLQNWWQTLGGGEWSPENSELKIITARENDKLIGIAPLFSSFKDGSPKALRFIGQVEITDYLDFIALPSSLEAFLSGMLDYIDTNPEFETKRLELANFRDDTPSIALFEELSRQKGRTVDSEVLQPAPTIILPSTWEDYLQNLSKKQRHEVRRKERNLERDFEAELIFSNECCDLDVEMLNFIAMMRNEDDKAKFLSPLMETALIDMAKAAQKAGCLSLASLYLNGEQAAAYLNFIKDDRIWVYNTGWNPKFSDSSPGWALLTKLIQWGIENGMKEVDLMRGDEGYKYRFGASDRQVLQIVSDYI